MAAILEAALDDLRKKPTYLSSHTPDERQRKNRLIRLKNNAIDWFEDDDDTYVFSFPSVTQTLFSAHPASIREALRASHLLEKESPEIPRQSPKRIKKPAHK